MATRVIYCDPTATKTVTCTSGTYTAALNGTGSQVADPALASISQSNSFSVTQYNVVFDTSSLSPSAIISSVSIDTLPSTQDATPTYNCNLYYHPSSPAWIDLVAGVGGLTLAYSVAHTSIGTLTAFSDISGINKGSPTKLVWISSRAIANTTPSSPERTILTDNRTFIQVVDNSTQSSLTINAGTTTFTPSITGYHDIDFWGGGSKNAAASNQEAGGQGASYGFGVYNITSLSDVTVQVAASQTTFGTAGNDTWFASSSTTGIGASGGSATTGTASGNAFDGCVIQWLGGAGAAAQGGGGSRAGSGGGGSAGTADSGWQGTQGSGNTAGTGGSAFSGGGKGGNGGVSGSPGQDGTAPGGGSGGAGNGSSITGWGAAGKMIVYWFAYPANKSFPPFFPFRAFQHMIVR